MSKIKSVVISHVFQAAFCPQIQISGRQFKRLTFSPSIPGFGGLLLFTVPLFVHYCSLSLRNLMYTETQQDESVRLTSLRK